jgi:hypothetical protein
MPPAAPDLPGGAPVGAAASLLDGSLVAASIASGSRTSSVAWRLSARGAGRIRPPCSPASAQEDEEETVNPLSGPQERTSSKKICAWEVDQGAAAYSHDSAGYHAGGGSHR